MRTCQSCGLQNPPERDFCECGEYLRWEPTAIVSAVTPEMAAQAAAEAAPAEPEPPPTPEPAAPEAPAPPAAAAPRPAPEPTGYVEATPPPPPPRVEEAPLPPTVAPSNGQSERAAAPPPPTGPKGTEIMNAAPAPVPVPAQPAAPAQPPEPDMATISLRLPDKDSDKEHSLVTSVEPGQRERILALVRNQSGIVDNYKLSIDGLPPEWWSIYPDTVYLVPFGSGGTYEQEVEIHLHPPRTPKAEAKLWALKVSAHSKAHETTATEEPFALVIKPYVDTTTKVRPERKKGRRKADYDVTVENKANAPVLIALEGEDPDAELGYGFNRPPTEIPPGQTVNTGMRVRPPKQIWIGRAQERRFSVITLTGEAAEERLAAEPTSAEEIKGKRTDGITKKGWFGRAKRGDLPGAYGPRVYKPQVYAPGMNIGPSGISFRKPNLQAPQLQGPQMKGMNLDANQLKDKMPGLGGGGAPAGPAVPLLPSQAIFRQKPWLPWWLIPVAIALAALAVMFYLLLPKNELVPNVVGKPSAFEAEKTLTKAGLKLNPDQKTEPNTKVKPGTVIKQDPPPGKKAEKGSAVTIVTAVGNGKVTVPDLAGLKLADAEKKLRESKLTLGQSNPQPPDPEGKIQTQVPAKDEIVKEGAPVDVFFVDPNAKNADKKKAGDKKGGDKKAGALTAAEGQKGGDIVIPAIDGAKQDEYAKRLADKGLIPDPKRAFDASPPNTLFATDPVGGTQVKANTKVTLLISAGFPEVAYDNDKDILLRNGATGKQLDPIADSSRVEKDPSFSADGTRVAYQAGGQVFLANREKPDSTDVTVTASDEFYKDLQFAPTPETNLLSMIKVNNDGSRQLCFEVISKNTLQPRCLPKPDNILLDRKINWAPDGKTILVFGLAKDQSKFGMVRYRTSKPFSSDTKDWKGGTGFSTDTTNQGKGVFDMAFSPDGKTLAVASTLNDQGAPRLSLGKPNDLLTTKTTPLGVQACKVIWRPDGRDLVVVQADNCGNAPTGRLVRFPLKDPKDQHQIALVGDNPTFQPLQLGG